MTTIDDAMSVLGEDECWTLLAHASVGRLAVDVAGQPDIFPINYVVDGRSLVFRTAAGTKLAGAVLMRNVAFEIDGFEPHDDAAWSVVVKGVAHLIERRDDLYAAEDLPLYPWLASPKPDFVRIEPRAVTGRRFHVVDGVTPDASIGWSETARVAHTAPPSEHGEYHRGASYMTPD